MCTEIIGNKYNIQKVYIYFDLMVNLLYIFSNNRMMFIVAHTFYDERFKCLANTYIFLVSNKQ